MNIEQEFLTVLSELNHDPRSQHPIDNIIIPLIDFTLLDKEASQQALETFQEKIDHYPIAAVCVYPQHLKRLTIPTSIKKASVVNFPAGNESSNVVCQEIVTLIQDHHIDEIDYVFPQGKHQEITATLQHCQNAYRLCQQHHITFKVILETGNINNADDIYTLSRKIIEQGCDFIKTSTGKTDVGATPLAAYAILRAIHDSKHPNCGLKVSGGIKTPQQAWFYIMLAEHCCQKQAAKNWLRIGASSLLDHFQKCM